MVQDAMVESNAFAQAEEQACLRRVVPNGMKEASNLDCSAFGKYGRVRRQIQPKTQKYIADSREQSICAKILKVLFFMKISKKIP